MGKRSLQSKILILGDSHARVFNYVKDENFLCDVVVSPGATSRGINNPNSKTNTMNIFNKKLKEYKNYNWCILMLGEVDCGFTIWVAVEKHQSSLLKEFKQSITAYNIFVKQLIKLFSTNIILVGANIPTILDNTEKKFLNGERASVVASYNDRLRLTKTYNQKLKQIAKKHHLHYIDITDIILNQSTNLVKDEFKKNDRYDHHLDDIKTSSIWKSKLQKIL